MVIVKFLDPLGIKGFDMGDYRGKIFNGIDIKWIFFIQFWIMWDYIRLPLVHIKSVDPLGVLGSNCGDLEGHFFKVLTINLVSYDKYYKFCTLLPKISIESQ